MDDIKAIASATSPAATSERFGKESAAAGSPEGSLLAVGSKPADTFRTSNVSMVAFSLAQMKRKKILHYRVSKGQRREETRLRDDLDGENNAVLNAAGDGTLTTSARTKGTQ